MKKSILLILAPGFEEIEAVAPVDILRRAEIDVTLASLEDDLSVRGKQDMVVTAEVKLNDVINKNFDALVLVGGPGAQKLKEDDRVIKLVKKFYDEEKIIGAICSAPTILKKAGILDGKKYAAHFTVKDQLPDIQPLPVVIDGKIITSPGPATAIPFGLALVEALTEKSTADKIAKDLCYQ